MKEFSTSLTISRGSYKRQSSDLVRIDMKITVGSGDEEATRLFVRSYVEVMLNVYVVLI